MHRVLYIKPRENRRVGTSAGKSLRLGFFFYRRDYKFRIDKMRGYILIYLTLTFRYVLTNAHLFDPFLYYLIPFSHPTIYMRVHDCAPPAHKTTLQVFLTFRIVARVSCFIVECLHKQHYYRYYCSYKYLSSFFSVFFFKSW